MFSTVGLLTHCSCFTNIAKYCVQTSRGSASSGSRTREDETCPKLQLGRAVRLEGHHPSSTTPWTRSKLTKAVDALKPGALKREGLRKGLSAHDHGVRKSLTKPSRSVVACMYAVSAMVAALVDTP